MPNPITSNATLHALTERLASHSRSINPLGFPAIDRLAALRQQAAPPQLPVLQFASRHQEVPQAAPVENGVSPENRRVRCPYGEHWPERGVHDDVRTTRCHEEDMDGFVEDLGMVMRREFDCWVEQCWTEAFHHLFTHTLPTLLIHLILTGASPTFLRRQIVHGGPDLDYMFQSSILDTMFFELEMRLSGERPSEIGTRPPMNISPIPQPNAPPPGMPRDGVCFRSYACQHGASLEDDDHSPCLCQLATCITCFQISAASRKGPISLLPYELADTFVSAGWTGGVESSAQAQARMACWRRPPIVQQPIPQSHGYVRNVKPNHGPPKPTPMFAHPQMTDVLAVEEHLRWRLKEMGAADPAVESRYGPSTNAPAALEGVDLPELDDPSEEGSVKGAPQSKPKLVKVTRGKGKMRRMVNGGVVPPKKKDDTKKDEKPKSICYLPKEWAEEEPSVRNMAIVLTFRHFVKLLHQIATNTSPFSYPAYSNDVADLLRVHPVALYRRLAEPSLLRKPKPNKDLRPWQDCMDKWAEELGAREKAQGNRLVSEDEHAEAVEYYTRAISLDGKKTVYFSNRAVALNALGEHERAEMDCRHILTKDSKNGKAFYQRAVARKGLGRWREAEADLKEVLKFQPGNESAKKLLGMVKAEVAKLPKQSAKDALNF